MVKKNNKKRSKKINLDVYTADDGDIEADKLMRRRGGGGGALGRTMDTQETVDYIKETIDASDDEEITEDDAFDDSDEDKFGLFFTQNKKKKVKANELDLNEEENTIDSESDVDGDEYVDLSEMLKDESENETMLIPERSDSDLDLGLGDSDLSEDTDIEVGDLSSVLNVSGEKKRKRLSERTEACEESEFKVGKNSIRKKLDLSDLVNPMGEETNFASLKSQLEVLEKTQTGAINAPLAPRMQDRLNRQAAKIETEKSISKWTQKVKKNRENDELLVPYKEPASVNLSSGALVGKFEPFTEMEKEINEVLEKSGLTEKKQKEREELELNKLSKEEMIERRAELTTMRSLMFYKEQKQKKVAKIKSKTYRKIAKKALEKGQVGLTIEELEKLDPLKAQEERDKLEFERAKERMTLKHNNTGKWAKKMLRRNDGAGAESQKALMDQLRKGDELRKRIDGFESGDSEFEEVKDQNDKEELIKLRNQIDEEKVPEKGIFSMKFMQRGLENQKKEAKEAIADAYREIDNLSDYDEDKVAVNARRIVDHNPVDHKRKKPVKQIQIKSDGFEIASSGPVNINPLFKVEAFDDLLAGKTNVFIGDANKSEKEIFNKTSAFVGDTSKSEKESFLKDEPVAKIEECKEAIANLEYLKNPAKKVDVSNPWLTVNEQTMVKKSIQSVHKQFERASKSEKAIQKLKTEKQKLLTTQIETDCSVKKAKKIVPVEDLENPEEQVLIHSSNLTKINNKELMKMAFANDDIEQAFNKEKLQTIEEDIGKEIINVLPGWGTWGGPQIPLPKPKIQINPFGVDKLNRQDKNKKHVIINEKRVKKLSQYMQKKLPVGFENRDQYEKTLVLPLGKEWNTSSTHIKMVKPRLETKIGHAIIPLSLNK